MNDTPVLVVGAGPVALVLAVELNNDRTARSSLSYATPKVSFLQSLQRWLRPRATTVKKELRWHLFVGDELLGELRYLGHETPWVTCSFERNPRFAHYEFYFDRGDSSGTRSPDEWHHMQSLKNEVRDKGGFRLVDVTTGVTDEHPHGIHIDGAYAKFRDARA